MTHEQLKVQVASRMVIAAEDAVNARTLEERQRERRSAAEWATILQGLKLVSVTE